MADGYTSRRSMNTGGYQQQQLEEMKRQLGLLAATQQTMALTVGRIEDQLKSISADIEAKVSRDVYEGALARINDRIVRLEGGSLKFLNWLAVGLSGCAVMLTALAMAGAILGYVIAHH